MSDDGWKDILSGGRGGPDGWLPTDAPGAGPNGGKAWVAGGSGSMVAKLLAGLAVAALYVLMFLAWFIKETIKALWKVSVSKRR